MTTTQQILIADSGATKTNWCLTANGEILHQLESKGISPIYQSPQEIADEISRNVFPLLKDRQIDAVRFYGSGCTPENSPAVHKAIRQSLPTENINVFSDLLAAAHALCGHTPGIACILGTGSNSCQWNGIEIVSQVSPLGFILGDEGSGGSLGKHLVGNALKNQLTPGLKEKLLAKYNLTPAAIIDNVYRQPFPSRFLASLTPFLAEHIEEKTIRRIVEQGFADFFERNLMQYDYQHNSVHFTGSIAWHFADILRQTASQKGITTGKIEQSPMQGLINFYNTSKEE